MAVEFLWMGRITRPVGQDEKPQTEAEQNTARPTRDGVGPKGFSSLPALALPRSGSKGILSAPGYRSTPVMLRLFLHEPEEVSIGRAREGVPSWLSKTMPR